MPFRREFSALGTDIVYDTGDYAGLLDKFLNRAEWERLRADVARRRQAGEMVGLGLGFFVEKSGLGPFDDVRITLGGDGTIEVITGAVSIGQGVETVMAQFCADGLGSRRGSGCGRHIA
jgi:carbon-monoxide dehydrogenase large subunit